LAAYVQSKAYIIHKTHTTNNTCPMYITYKMYKIRLLRRVLTYEY